MNQPYILLLLLFLCIAESCGSEDDAESASPKTINELFPADNEIGNWVENSEYGSPNVVDVANTNDEAIDLIDGSADPFVEHGFIAFGIEYYISGESEMNLQVWQMNNAQVARELYSDLTSSNNVYMAQPWEDIDIGQEARIADTGVHLWVNARSGSTYVEAKINQVSDQARTDAQAFAKAVLSKL